MAIKNTYFMHKRIHLENWPDRQHDATTTETFCSRMPERRERSNNVPPLSGASAPERMEEAVRKIAKNTIGYTRDKREKTGLTRLRTAPTIAVGESLTSNKIQHLQDLDPCMTVRHGCWSKGRKTIFSSLRVRCFERYVVRNKKTPCTGEDRNSNLRRISTAKLDTWSETQKPT
jgi:hypothetical protein